MFERICNGCHRPYICRWSGSFHCDDCQTEPNSLTKAATTNTTADAVENLTSAGFITVELPNTIK
jgi:uncharacterized Zn ribbon protein